MIRLEWTTVFWGGVFFVAMVACAADSSKSATDTADPSKTVGDPCLNAGTPGATASCLAPTQTPEYYVAQAHKYFDTLDQTADPQSIPSYSVWVVRWEWPPWLMLTGYGRDEMIEVGEALKVVDPSTVPIRDCRAFDTQPFARCVVTFEYEDGPCPIYEEFVFNDAGEMTFIEAWSDLPGLRPQRGSIERLSTRVPGLGKPDGLVDWESSWVVDAAVTDPDLADLAERTTDWWKYWYEAVAASPPDFFGQGCGW